MIIIGIDPGMSGAIVRLDTETSAVRIADMPTMEDGSPVRRLVRGRWTSVQKNRVNGLELIQILRGMSEGVPGVRVALEAIVARPEGNAKEDGERRGNSMQSQAAMIGTRYAILTVCDVLALPVDEVAPQKWKKALGLLKASKKVSIETARRLYPHAADGLKRTRDDGRAEALLIAHYAAAMCGSPWPAWKGRL